MKHTSIASLVLVSLITAFVFTGPTQAQVPTATVGSCTLEKRFDGWDDAIKHGVSFQDFHDMWGDLFERNTCQRDDLYSIEKLLEQNRQQLRKKFYSCNTEGMEKLIKNEVKFQVEMKYLRSFVDTNEDNISENGAISLKKDRNTVYSELYEDIVETRSLMGKESFDKLFLKLEAKYSPRLQKYLECKDPTWEELTEKWNTFVDSAAGTVPAWERLEKRTEKKFKRIKDTPGKRTGNYLDGLLNVRVNGVDPERGFGDIQKQFEESYGTPITFLELLDSADIEQNRYQYEINRAQRLSRYDAQYRFNSDDATEELVGLVKSLNEKIEGSFDTLDVVKGCTAWINEQQCSE